MTTSDPAFQHWQDMWLFLVDSNNWCREEVLTVFTVLGDRELDWSLYCDHREFALVLSEQYGKISVNHTVPDARWSQLWRVVNGPAADEYLGCADLAQDDDLLDAVRALLEREAVAQKTTFCLCTLHRLWCAGTLVITADETTTK